jgi:hypothetical protein
VLCAAKVVEYDAEDVPVTTIFADKAFVYISGFCEEVYQRECESAGRIVACSPSDPALFLSVFEQQDILPSPSSEYPDVSG